MDDNKEVEVLQQPQEADSLAEGAAMEPVVCQRAATSAWTGWMTSLCVLIGAVFGFALVLTAPSLLSDEGFHGPQVWDFFTDNFTLRGNLTMLPTYHAGLALVARALRYYHDNLLRLTTLLVGLSLPWFAWRMVKLHAPLDAGRRAAQLFYLPLLFSFFFVIYTDVWTSAAIIACCLCAWGRRFWLAGLAGLLAVLLRQDAVIWVGLAWLWIAFEGCEGWSCRIDWRRTCTQAARHGLPLLGVFLLFAAFVVWNGGVAVGDRSAHQSGFNVTNVYVLLFCAWLTFLPVNLEALPRILMRMRRPVVIGGLLVGFLIYMATYSNTHGYNGEGMRFWLHNELLYWPTKYLAVRALGYIGIAWMVLTLCVTRLAEPRLYWLYPVALLAAAMHPLIEPRYFLPGILLLQICRPTLDEHWENALLVLNILLSAVVMFGTVTKLFFI